jgi:hypothetical protein
MNVNRVHMHEIGTPSVSQSPCNHTDLPLPSYCTFQGLGQKRTVTVHSPAMPQNYGTSCQKKFVIQKHLTSLNAPWNHTFSRLHLRTCNICGALKRLEVCAPLNIMCGKWRNTNELLLLFTGYQQFTNLGHMYWCADGMLCLIMLEQSADEAVHSVNVTI